MNGLEGLLPSCVFDGYSQASFYFWFGYEIATSCYDQKLADLLKEQIQMRQILDKYVQIAMDELSRIQCNSSEKK